MDFIQGDAKEGSCQRRMILNMSIRNNCEILARVHINCTSELIPRLPRVDHDGEESGINGIRTDPDLHSTEYSVTMIDLEIHESNKEYIDVREKVKEIE